MHYCTNCKKIVNPTYTGSQILIIILLLPTVIFAFLYLLFAHKRCPSCGFEPIDLTYKYFHRDDFDKHIECIPKRDESGKVKGFTLAGKEESLDYDITITIGDSKHTKTFNLFLGKIQYIELPNREKKENLKILDAFGEIVVKDSNNRSL